MWCSVRRMSSKQLCLTGGLAVLATFALPGCASLLGIESPGEAVDAGPDADPFPCVSDSLAQSVSFDTTSAADGYTLTCGSAGSNDEAFSFTAPATDYYLFSTMGSSFDTVLALTTQCGGAEEMCSQNTGEATYSELVYKVEKDRSVVLIVDGFAGARGAAELWVEPVTCPVQDLEGQGFPLPLSTREANGIEAACPAPFQGTAPLSPGRDAAYHWAPAEAGLYAFQLTEADFDAVISLRKGPRCTDENLACGTGDRARVVRHLEAGEPVSIVVDAVQADAGGSFELNIEKLDATCPGDPLPMVVQEERVVTVDSFPATATLAASCAPYDVPDQGAHLVKMGDAVFRVETPTAEGAGKLDCFVTATSKAPFALYALDGDDCTGAELACQPAVSGKNGLEAQVELRAKPGTAFFYNLVVARASVETEPVTLTTFCARADF
jgi:hypothetical protein